MRLSLPQTLLALAGSLAAFDLVWAIAGHFQLDWPAYARLGLLAGVLLGAAWIYHRVRPDPRLSAMLFGAGFLCAFSLGASVLNYLLLTRAGARIDLALAQLDRALGFDWPAAMAWFAAHPALNSAALVAYSSMLPQVAAMIIVLALADTARVYRFSAALSLSALACIAVWCLAPSFGAFSVYAAPRMTLALDGGYARELVALLHDGPGIISPHDAKGLIGFPSYHAVLALLVMWHARKLSWLRWPAVLLNIAVLVATPIQGGHHLMDVLGAFPIAAFAIFLTRARGEAAKDPGMVNKRPNLTLEPVPLALFRASAAQKSARVHNAIKPTLSGLP